MRSHLKKQLEETLGNNNVIHTPLGDGIDRLTVCNVLEVYIITTPSGADVMLIEPHAELTPEDIATSQAMYSRSNKSMVLRFIDLLQGSSKEDTKERIVGQTHKGYGHKSIGDLGSLLFCYEGVSMLAAKAIQDSQLYNGQEASTRYISFKNQAFLYPNAPKDPTLQQAVIASSKQSPTLGDIIMEDWRSLYLDTLDSVEKYVFTLYPWTEQNLPDAEKANYERAIKARSLDIARGLLPAGCSTSLAWYTSISHAAEHLSWLRCHPLEEVCELAQATQILAETVYPISFEGRTVYPERETYKQDFMQYEYYLLPEHADPLLKYDRSIYRDNKFGLIGRRRWEKIIKHRPKGQEMHYSVGECGVLYYTALLDFASFRDQQRHRAVVQRHGLITAEYGFHEWYVENMPKAIQTDVKAKIDSLLEVISNIEMSPIEKQYLYPMGMKIPTTIVGPLGKMLYMVELRAQNTVHPTYHANAYELGKSIQETLSRELGVPIEDIPLYVDSNVGSFSWKRGQQTLHVGGKDISQEE